MGRRGRPRTNLARKHFSYNSESNTSTCQIAGCTHVITGDHGGNLERHLRERHPQEHANLSAEKAVSTKRASSGGDEGSSKKKPGQVDRASMSQPTSSKCILLELTPRSIMESCVELVMKNGRPLGMFDDSGFRNIIDPVLGALGAKGYITAESVAKRIQEKAKSKREEIYQLLSKRMFSLKIDYVKESGRQVLATSVQYAEKEGLVLQPLAVNQVSELDDDVLMSLVESVFPRYDTSDSHLYSITTKVGDAVLRSVCVRSKAEDEEQGSRSVQDPDGGYFFCKADGPPSVKREVGEVLDEGDEFVEVGGCVMQALKLAVSDALKKPSTHTTIEKCRKLVKKLSVRSAMKEIKQRKLKMPVSDSSKTWVATFKMLTRLLELKDFAAEFLPEEELQFRAESTWETVKEITTSLQPAQVFMDMLLTEQLTLGDFYGAWLKCVLGTSSIGSPLAKALVQCMETRERDFRDTNTFCAALYMDPRYRVALKTEQKRRAITHLKKTWKRISGIKQMQNDTRVAPEEQDGVDVFLDKMGEIKIGKNRNVSGKLDTEAIERSLEKLDEEPRVRRDKNVFKYWEGRKEFEPELHALAQVVLAVPVTQKSEKHVRSALRNISFDERVQMSSGTLDDLLFLKSCS